MATSAPPAVRERITLKEDIQIRDFAQGGALPNSAIFYYNDKEPFCKVFVNPVSRSNPEFVSVRFRRCSFFPRFYPELVYKSLGWMVSVVDDEGAEKFTSYFVYDDFQKPNCVEDIFSGPAYEFEEFVKRSVLLDDPERFLPEGVLTVHVEMFYECLVGDKHVVLHNYENEIDEFVQTNFNPEKRIDAQLDSNSRGEEPVEISKDKGSIAEDAKKSVEVLMEFEYMSLEERKKESIVMMEEAFQELKEAMELSVHLECVKPDYTSEGSCEKLMKDIELFQGLFMKAGIEPPIEWDFSARMMKPFQLNDEFKHLIHILDLHMHLHMHDGKTMEEDDGKNTEGARKHTVAEGIRELFFIYNKIAKENQPKAPDHLLICVSRFLEVFFGVIRVLSYRITRLFCDRDYEFTYISDFGISMEEVYKFEDISSNTSTSMESESIGKPDLASSMDKTNLETSEGDKEPWYLTIETSEGKRTKIPFQTGRSNLGSRIRSTSSVFDRMLETPMTEKANRFLKINDFEYSTFSQFLSFLQLGRVAVVTLGDCMELYRFAHKYQVEELLPVCVKKIEEKISYDTSEVEKLSEFSELYQDDRLLRIIENYRYNSQKEEKKIVQRDMQTDEYDFYQ